VIQSINNIGIAVRDLARSIAFYEKLGFQVQDRDEETPAASLQAGHAWLYIFQTSSRELAASRAPELVQNPPGIDHISFDVPDVDEFYDRLKDELTFEGEPADQTWGARAVSLLDPDGNRLYFLSPLKGA